MGDLCQFPDDYTWHNRFNGKSFAYILVLVDCFSKKMWCEALSKKTKEETANALIKIFDSMTAPPTMFVTDHGSGIFFFGITNEKNFLIRPFNQLWMIIMSIILKFQQLHHLKRH